MDYEDIGFEMLADYPDILKSAEVMEILGIRKNLFYELVNDGSLKDRKDMEDTQDEHLPIYEGL